MVAIALNLVQVEVGFFVAATVIVLLRQITPREAYDAIDWPIIVMLGSLIPVGEALKDTGAAKMMADGLTMLASLIAGILRGRADPCGVDAGDANAAPCGGGAGDGADRCGGGKKSRSWAGRLPDGGGVRRSL